MAWLTGWKYRKKITIQGSSGAGTNYQVLLRVGESSGATGADFHLEGLADNFPSGKNQGGDLRFTSSDGSTLLDFWVENVIGTAPNRVAYVWVEVSEDLGNNRDIFCYFGNPNATNASNIVNTFIDGDDFTLNTVTQYTVVGGSIAYDSVNKRLNITGTSGNTVVAKTNAQSLASPYVIEAKMSVVRRGTGDSQGNYVSAVLGFKTTLTGNNGYAFDFGRLATTLTSHISVEKYTVAHLQTAPITFSDGVLYLIKGRCQAGNLQTTFERTTSTPVSTDTSYTSGYYGLRTWYADSVVDWWFVRKFVSPEPAFFSAGPLEFLGSRRRLLLSTY
jgi:hypothetical protein